MTVPAVRGADREDRLGPVPQALADPDQQPGRERHACRPASSSTRSRTAGSLSGLPTCAGTCAVVSSIIPIDGATGFSRCSSAHDITPGFRCGSRPVSSSTATAQART